MALSAEQVDCHLAEAGDSYQIPTGVVHDILPCGDKPLKRFGVYIHDKTRPLASPAP